MTERVAPPGPSLRGTEPRPQSCSPGSACAREGAAFAIALSVLTACATANADGRVAFLSERLTFPPTGGLPDDFRIRMNAALALGTTNDEAAVSPLCGGLSDPSDIVRQTSATALARLGKPAAVDCLKRREPDEKKDSVRAQIHKAIATLEAASGGSSSPAPAAPNPNAHFYVVLSSLANHTDRGRTEIEPIAHSAIRDKLNSLGTFVVAVAGGSGELTTAQIQKRSLKGYYLSPTVEKFDNVGGALRVRVKLAVLTFPGKDLKGEIEDSASLPGARVGDHSSEDQLITAVLADAADKFAQKFH